ncbi:MAG: hypothetical protein ACFB2Z_01225 [Maricaulaceae bacterium]
MPHWDGKTQAKTTLWIELKPEALWTNFSGPLYRGRGNTTSPNFRSKNGFRSQDIDIRHDNETNTFWVYPNPEKGFSFATNMERLERIRIKGWVWMLPQGQKIPDGLLFNLNKDEPDHPLLNVSKKMTVDALDTLLESLKSKMKPTNYKIKGS